MNNPALSTVYALMGAVVLVVATTRGGIAEDYVGSRGTAGVGTRCAALGPDYAAVEGGDTCVRIGGHVRVQFGASNASLDPIGGWAASHASSATLHVEGTDKTPSGATSHLRVRGGLEYPNPFH